MNSCIIMLKKGLLLSNHECYVELFETDGVTNAPIFINTYQNVKVTPQYVF